MTLYLRHLLIEKITPVSKVMYILDNFPNCAKVPNGEHGVVLSALHLAIFAENPNLLIIQKMIDMYPIGLLEVDDLGETVSHLLCSMQQPRIDILRIIIDSKVPKCTSIFNNAGKKPIHKLRIFSHTLSQTYDETYQLEVLRLLIQTNPRDLISEITELVFLHTWDRGFSKITKRWSPITKLTNHQLSLVDATLAKYAIKKALQLKF